MNDILENVLTTLLEPFFGYDDSTIDMLLENPNLMIKERIKKLEDLEVWIYSNDHNPPHFHVKSNDLKIDAKFKIETGELISGTISSRDIKKVTAFYNSRRAKEIMQLIWNKRLNS